MIFNPLFLSETDNSQLLARKSTKLSKNKYLFSDIVKVVMNPISDQKKVVNNSENILGQNIGLSLENDLIPIQLKLKFLSDIDNEKAELGLTEILPEEIAKLLLNDNSENNDNAAISYISRDVLQGELRNFVNNLIGPEVIRKNISNESGLLLSIEDTNSAVNLELAKENKSNSSPQKISVQTIVVPRKSKLISILGDGKTRSSLLKTDSPYVGKSQVQKNEIIKPTLSIYSFRYKGDNFESLTKSIMTNYSNIHKLNAENVNKGLTTKVENTPLEKISFVPSEIKLDQMRKNNSLTDNTLNLKQQKSNLTLFDNNRANEKKEYSVNRITIVKKNGENLTQNNLFVKSEQKTNKAELGLRKIEFLNKGESDVNKANKELVDKSKLVSRTEILREAKTLSEVKSNTNSELSSDNLKHIPRGMSQNNYSHENIENLKIVNKELNVNETKIKLKNISSLEKFQINEKEPNSSKIKLSEQKDNINQENKVNKKNENIPIKNSNSEVTRFKNITKSLDQSNIKIARELDNNIQSHNISKQEVDFSDITSKVNDAKLFKIQTTIDNQIVTKTSEIKDPEKLSNTKQNIEKNTASETKENITKMEKINSNSGKYDHIEKNVVTPNKNENSKNNSLENITSNDENIHKQKIDITETDKVVINANNISVDLNKSEIKNRKISVKVKSGLKNISNKADGQNSVVNDSNIVEKVYKNESTNADSNTLTTNKSFNDQFSFKAETENSFGHILNNPEKVQSSNGILGGSNEIGRSKPLRIVKSIEIIRELSKFISQKESGSLSFDIKPEHLGHMKITLDTVDNILKAKIEVDNEQAKQMIEKNLDKLQQELSENGVKLNSLNISLGYSKQQENEKELEKNNGSNKQNPGQVGEAEEEEQKKSFGYNTYEYIA